MPMKTEPSINRTHISKRIVTLWRRGAALAVVVAMFASAGAVSSAFAATIARAVTVTSGNVVATVTLAVGKAVSGQNVGVMVNLDVGTGWHIYGEPLPQEYQPTTIKFDDDLVARQSMDFPKPTPVEFKVLHQTLPVYQGSFKVPGTLVLKQKLAPGEHKLSGMLSFQECNDELCKMPQKVRFELPITIQRPATAEH
ncbi:MAG: protein-disulfide reductase DsbD domain-containing protein [Candidatus Binataceae bacterium]